jgi:putative transposase
MPTAEMCRRHGLSPASFYKFKAKYGAINGTDTHQLKFLEYENTKLKRLLADAMVDNAVFKG